MDLAITGIEMVTCVGRDAATTCASIRAGLTRRHALPFRTVLDGDGTASPLMAHAIRGFTDGFHLQGRWIRLAERAFDNLVRAGCLAAPTDTSFWANTALFLATPRVERERFGLPAPLTETDVRGQYGAALVQRLGLAGSLGHCYTVCRDHTGAVAALAMGRRKLQQREIKRFVVLAADSYLDTYSLDWLEETGRLKLDDSAAGLTPGEGAAAVVIEPLAYAKSCAAVLIGLALSERSAPHDDPEKPRHGQALASVIAAALGDATSWNGDLITDGNGETWRARELGGALSMVSHRLAFSSPVHLPAISLGETGAASCVLGLCIAARAHQRGYASAAQSLVISSSPHGDVGALLVRREEPPFDARSTFSSASSSSGSTS
jgi:3-oxoacyl-[acyl-carrier-protein] synthase-1